MIRWMVGTEPGLGNVVTQQTMRAGERTAGQRRVWSAEQYRLNASGVFPYLGRTFYVTLEAVNRACPVLVTTAYSNPIMVVMPGELGDGTLGQPAPGGIDSATLIAILVSVSVTLFMSVGILTVAFVRAW